jgi:hypothetical protein
MRRPHWFRYRDVFRVVSRVEPSSVPDLAELATIIGVILQANKDLLTAVRKTLSPIPISLMTDLALDLVTFLYDLASLGLIEVARLIDRFLRR